MDLSSKYELYEAVIGLEIHAQLTTQKKLFSKDSALFGGGDNEHISSVSLGFPGALPRLNWEAVRLGVRGGLALNCQIAKASIFERKNYFYPDLPKGYQISQYSSPLCLGGWVNFFHGGELNCVHLIRAHLEEDAGQSIHYGYATLLNYNRSGIPLLEIVSQPEIKNPSQAAAYARAVRKILLYAQICDGNMEEGSLRFDCNVSVRKKGEKTLGTKVEIKNLNSFRFIEKALDYEIHRQIDILPQPILQETRLWDSDRNRTVAMRSKEEAHDYRYFPDPDLPPILLTKEFIEEQQQCLPESPFVCYQRLVENHGLSSNEAEFLTEDRELGEYFEMAMKAFDGTTADHVLRARSVANWIMGEFTHWMKVSKLENHQIFQTPVTPENLALLIQMIEKGTISGKMAKTIFELMWKTNQTPNEIVRNEGLHVISEESEIDAVVSSILDSHPNQVKEYLNGKQKVFGFLVGQIMRSTKGQADPQKVDSLLRRSLENRRS